MLLKVSLLDIATDRRENRKGFKQTNYGQIIKRLSGKFKIAYESYSRHKSLFQHNPQPKALFKNLRAWNLSGKLFSANQKPIKSTFDLHFK